MKNDCKVERIFVYISKNYRHVEYFIHLQVVKEDSQVTTIERTVIGPSLSVCLGALNQVKLQPVATMAAKFNGVIEDFRHISKGYRHLENVFRCAAVDEEFDDLGATGEEGEFDARAGEIRK